MNPKLKKILKENIYLILIASICLLYLIPLFHSGFPLGQDDASLIVRTAVRIQSMSDGQFPSRWASGLNYGYGSPGLIFFYPLSAYIAALLYYVGLNLETSYKLIIGACFILSPIFFFLWTRLIFKEKIAFFSSILFALSPYIFLNLYVRIHIGEMLALTIIPLVLLFIEKNIKKPATFYIILGGIFYGMLIHSHTILAFIFSFVFASYLIIRSYPDKRKIIANFSLLLLGLLLSAYFWLPAILEGKYINHIVFLKDWYQNNFLGLNNVIYSPWGYGADVNKIGGLSGQVGPILFLLVLLSILAFLRNKKNRRIIGYWIIVFIIAVFMSISVSGFIWERINILKQFEFPWRFTSVSMFSAAVLSGYVFTHFKNKFYPIIFIFITVLLSLPMSQPAGYRASRPDRFYFNYSGTTTYHNEATTVWVSGDASSFPKKPTEIINGKGEVKDFFKKSNLHKFTINVKNDVTIVDNTIYFPGWTAEVDGRSVPIEFQDNNHRGLIEFKIPKGVHEVVIRFNESRARLLSDYISIFGIIISAILIYGRKKIDKLINEK